MGEHQGHSAALLPAPGLLVGPSGQDTNLKEGRVAWSTELPRSEVPIERSYPSLNGHSEKTAPGKQHSMGLLLWHPQDRVSGCSSRNCFSVPPGHQETEE